MGSRASLWLLCRPETRLGGTANQGGGWQGSSSVKQDLLGDGNQLPPPDRPTDRHLSPQGWSVGHGHVLGQERGAQTLVQHTKALGAREESQHPVFTVFTQLLGQVPQPRAAHPSSQPAQVCVHKPPTSAGRSLVRLQRGRHLPALGTAPKPPDSIPRAQPCPLCTPNPSAGCPQELRDTSGHAGTKPSSPTALSPRCLPPAPPSSAFIIREAGSTAGIGSNCCSCPGKAEEQSCGGSYTNV